MQTATLELSEEREEAANQTPFSANIKPNRVTQAPVVPTHSFYIIHWHCRYYTPYDWHHIIMHDALDALPHCWLASIPRPCSPSVISVLFFGFQLFNASPLATSMPIRRQYSYKRKCAKSGWNQGLQYSKGRHGNFITWSHEPILTCLSTKNPRGTIPLPRQGDLTHEKDNDHAFVRNVLVYNLL